jgi:hypothetical protein
MSWGRRTAAVGLGAALGVVGAALGGCGTADAPVPAGATTPAPTRPSPTTPGSATPADDVAAADAHDRSAAEDPTALLLRVDVVGGLCPDGQECRSATVVDRRGGWAHVAWDERTTTGALSAALLDDVVAVSDPAAARALAAVAPSPAGCERDHDGSEVVVVVHPGDPGEVQLSTCEHEVSGSELLRVVAEVLGEVSPGG